MSTQTIELEGFEIELGSDLYCDRGGDHHELVDRARSLIAGGLATTWMSQRLCVSGA